MRDRRARPSSSVIHTSTQALSDCGDSDTGPGTVWATGKAADGRRVAIARTCFPDSGPPIDLLDERGAGGDGPLHASHRGLWRAPRCRGWRGLCRMFNRATRGHTPPTYLSSDHDRLYQCHQWQANLRILDVEEIKTVPYVPLSQSIRGATDWHDSTRIPGPHALLDGRRSGDETPRVPALLQRRFILPHLAMCLKGLRNRALVVERLVSRPRACGAGPARPTWRRLPLPERTG
jgi:hypothetical protein